MKKKQCPYIKVLNKPSCVAAGLEKPDFYQLKCIVGQ